MPSAEQVAISGVLPVVLSARRKAAFEWPPIVFVCLPIWLFASVACQMRTCPSSPTEMPCLPSGVVPTP